MPRLWVLLPFFCLSGIASCSILNAPDDIVPQGTGGSGGAGGTTSTSTSTGGGTGGVAQGGGGAGGSGGSVPSECGDGILAPDEECDDSNVSDGDACSSLCKRVVFDIAADATIVNDGPDVGASDADVGAFVVVWRENNAGALSVKQVNFRATGLPIGPAGSLFGPGNVLSKPQLGTNSLRRSVVAWRDTNVIRFHAIEPDGTPSNAGLQAIAGAGSTAISDIGTKSSGELCIVWFTPSSPPSAQARCFDPQGSITPTSTQTIGVTDGLGTPGVWSAGSLFVAATNGGNGALGGRGLDAAGVPQGVVFPLPSNGNENRNPVGLALGGMGAHVAVFEQVFNVGPATFTRLTMRKFQNLNTPAALDSFVSASADHDEEGGAIAGANAKFVVAWTDNNVNFGDILAQVFDGMGEKLGVSIQVNKTAPGGTQRAVKAAANADGDVMFVWESEQPGGITKISALVYPRLLPL